MGKKSSNNMVWMDLEMTGLDVEKEVIIEIATIITDSELNVLAKAPCMAIHQPDEILERMDEWNTRHHNASGLVQRVRQSHITVEEAERQTLRVIKEFCPPNAVPLCGNSVSQDRKFLEKYMKELYAHLHYRSIDVTSIKEVIRRWYPEGPQFPKKSNAHMASVDIQESLDELIFYRKHYFSDEVMNAVNVGRDHSSS
ncbi:MAG: oligoribonuclease [Candidatus Nitrohelix vancouverensis]|uniref:Oligoribonuclease n=1 Tax=Candidatus Nitrohelix vancouverensis TaxID=2705534 RepID=A0A7T0C1K5_9BACT|nr:MAG: oligoribonuclease [Candidatus Nitrohelix vancouverensis]